MKKTWLLAVMLVSGCDMGTSVGDPADSGTPPIEVSKGDDGGVTPNPGPKRVFVTFNEYDGDLKTAGNGATGIEGADNLCALAAASVNLKGVWRAWISTTTVDAIDRIPEVGPWYDLYGGPGSVERAHTVFNNKANLQTGPLYPIRYDERGNEIQSSDVDEVWTGTAGNGRKSNTNGGDANCGDWLSGGPGAPRDGLAGSSLGIGKTWTDQYLLPCSRLAKLICIEI
jgi:hypothetical protein